MNHLITNQPVFKPQEVVDISIDKDMALSLMDETHYSMLLKVK